MEPVKQGQHRDMLALKKKEKTVAVMVTKVTLSNFCKILLGSKAHHSLKKQKTKENRLYLLYICV